MRHSGISGSVFPLDIRRFLDYSCQVNLFGETLSAPLLIAPIGVQSLFHPDGEIASAKAAHALGVPYIMSSASSRTIEEVAAANSDGKRWYQLYWYMDSLSLKNQTT